MKKQEEELLLVDPTTGEVDPLPAEHYTPTIQKNYSARFYPKDAEINNQPSETIPDQSMTVRELMARMASGLPLGGERVPLYNGEEDFPDLEKMDIHERHEFIKNAMDELHELQANIEKQAADIEERRKNQEKYDKALSYYQKLDAAQSPEASKQFLDAKGKEDEKK